MQTKKDINFTFVGSLPASCNFKNINYFKLDIDLVLALIFFFSVIILVMYLEGVTSNA